MTITQTFQTALWFAQLTGRTAPIAITEDHYNYLKQIHYSWVAPTDSTVAIWHIKPKEVANAD
jgi:hypothetical protein